MTESSIAQIVRDQVSKHRIAKLGLEVVETAIRRDGDLWYVPVRTEREPRHTYAYYDQLVEVEERIRKQEKVDVLLVPAGRDPMVGLRPEANRVQDAAPRSEPEPGEGQAESEAALAEDERLARCLDRVVVTNSDGSSNTLAELPDNQVVLIDLGARKVRCTVKKLKRMVGKALRQAEKETLHGAAQTVEQLAERIREELRVVQHDLDVYSSEEAVLETLRQFEERMTEGFFRSLRQIQERIREKSANNFLAALEALPEAAPRRNPKRPEQEIVFTNPGPAIPELPGEPIRDQAHYLSFLV